MANILVEINTNNILDNTTSEQDKAIIAEFLDKADDDALIKEVVDRELLSDVFAESRESEKQTLMDEWAEEYGFVKKEE